MPDALNAPEPTLANGFAHGRPEDRERLPLDLVIERVIAKIPASTRLYPDIYSWKVTDAILKELAKNQD